MQFQRRSSQRFRGRLASARTTVQHTSKHPLCWLYLDANTIVGMQNSCATSLSKAFQKYVLELHREAFSISPCLHGTLGRFILPDGSVSGLAFSALSFEYVLAGATHNFAGALLTRFFLGFVEAAFFPGALFLLSKWYKRSELGLRTALLSCGILISNAFGSLMASGILNGMQGKLGHAAWRSVTFVQSARES
jgi:hypothetical protein